MDELDATSPTPANNKSHPEEDITIPSSIPQCKPAELRAHSGGSVDEKTARRIRAIGVIFILFGVVGLLKWIIRFPSTIMLLSFPRSNLSESDPVLTFTALVVGIGFYVLLFLSGIGLWRLRKWARRVGIVLVVCIAIGEMALVIIHGAFLTVRYAYPEVLLTMMSFLSLFQVSANILNIAPTFSFNPVYIGSIIIIVPIVTYFAVMILAGKRITWFRNLWKRISKTASSQEGIECGKVFKIPAVLIKILGILSIVIGAGGVIAFLVGFDQDVPGMPWTEEFYTEFSHFSFYMNILQIVIGVLLVFGSWGLPRWRRWARICLFVAVLIFAGALLALGVRYYLFRPGPFSEMSRVSYMSSSGYLLYDEGVFTEIRSTAVTSYVTTVFMAFGFLFIAYILNSTALKKAFGIPFHKQAQHDESTDKVVFIDSDIKHILTVGGILFVVCGFVIIGMTSIEVFDFLRGMVGSKFRVFGRVFYYLNMLFGVAFMASGAGLALRKNWGRFAVITILIFLAFLATVVLSLLGNLFWYGVRYVLYFFIMALYLYIIQIVMIAGFIIALLRGRVRRICGGST